MVIQVLSSQKNNKKVRLIPTIFTIKAIISPFVFAYTFVKRTLFSKVRQKHFCVRKSCTFQASNTRYAVRSLFHNVAQPNFFPSLKILSGVKIHGLPNFPRQNFRGKKPRITLGIIRTFFMTFMLQIFIFLYNSHKFLDDDFQNHQRFMKTKIPTTTMGSNTPFLGEKAIRKGFFPTSYGKILCTQFSPTLLEFFGLALITNYQVVTNRKIYILQLSTRS